MIRTTRTRRFTAAVAGVSVLALGLAACSGDTEPNDNETTGGGDASGEQITLTIATFNNFGYTDELLQEYTDLNPNVKVEQNVAAKSDDARLNLTTKMAAGGTGLADIEAIEIDWMPELEIVKDSFADLEGVEGIDGRWLDWKEAQGRTTDGKLIGYGTDIGPQAICYRSDLFEEAGFDGSREAVADMIGGDGATWDSYFKAGEEFAAKSDVPWFDSAGAIWQGIVAQIPEPYENKADGTAKDLAQNTEIKAAYDQVTAASEKLSAGYEQWSEDWNAAFQNNGFATMLCPAWMTGPIESNSGGVEGWDVADVFPGGGANWGGSFLTVPAAGEHVEEAKKLAAWLTAPEQQIKAFNNAGTFPSQGEALSAPDLLEATNDFMSGAPVGQIFSNRAQNIDASTLPYKGPNYFKINSTISDALKRVDVEQSDDAAASWDKAVSAFNELGVM
ncbi:ABC transporter substrate-binding protein [Jonesia denitrificans]|uniref:Extracellular solute-binding protein family 1 n=1 Tax=Jonesia denitrificans (strain ATCC 14870 / DSM 20603 / BCRC 15368 / CIP 55.134 / JCM 11481 / NBRC 15587 / NCTC 10816 / Prevot 55134) TaxID=471856 RepID=C7QZW7_JONDD|nr:extracellular solute-binding protein [Jonesia denitrificans]ACV09525.1 extracellular solute-binding protein family 1 [Jonesia denitrificans DSM 20603]ASE09245.1 ABC transporter substrate-binding protein [Jonesia denitrificans]QXB43784.1 extracellular solute-binding protein [Jonesia denitrificans]SQH21913.1 Maltose-binding periplasmic proteins/domains [Jonesia denitrificans]